MVKKEKIKESDAFFEVEHKYDSPGSNDLAGTLAPAKTLFI